MAKKKDQAQDRQRMHELLREFGEDKITLEQFWKRMRQHGYTDQDIDRYCRGER